MRIAVVEVRVEADHAEQLLDAPVLLMSSRQTEVHQRLADDVADRHPRIEGSEGVLEDDLELLALLTQVLAAESGEVDAIEEDLARCHGQEPGDQPAQCRLSAAGLAHQTQGLPRAYVEAHPVDRLHGGSDASREVLDHVDHPEQGRIGRGRRGHGEDGRRHGAATSEGPVGPPPSAAPNGGRVKPGGWTPLAAPGLVSMMSAAPISSYARFIVTQQAAR